MLGIDQNDANKNIGGMKRSSDTSLGKQAIQGVARHATRHMARRVVLALVPFVVGIALIGMLVGGFGSSDAASGASNLTTSDISRYAKTDVVQPTCYTQSKSNSGGSCNSLIADVAAKCCGDDGKTGFGTSTRIMWSPPADPKWEYWAKLGTYVDQHQNTGHYNAAYASCTQFVEKVVMATVDKDIWGGSPDEMLTYFKGQGTTSGKWKEITIGDGEPSSYMQPGDVIASVHGTSGHDWFYIGLDAAKKYFPETTSEFAEANYVGNSQGFLPHVKIYDTAGVKSKGANGEVRVYRFVGKPDPIDGIEDAGIIEGSCAASSGSNASKNGSSSSESSITKLSSSSKKMSSF